MSQQDFVLNAQLREDEGKGASRRLRRQSLVPAIVYGDEKAPQSIALANKELVKKLESEAFYSQVITLDIAGNAEKVILKDLQRHPAKASVLHADFLRVSNSKKLTTKVPLHFINEESSKGVKLQGGSVSHNVTELEISCLAKDLPEYVEVDLADVEAGQIVHISDLKLPEGVESVALSHGSDHNLAIAAINKPKGSANSDDSDVASE